MDLGPIGDREVFVIRFINEMASFRNAINIEPIYLKEILCNLGVQREPLYATTGLRNGDPLLKKTVSPILVEYIFKMCDHLKCPLSIILNHRIKYTAIEMYQRFLIGHLDDIFDQVQTKIQSQGSYNWAETLRRLQKQVFLRLSSCIIISAKMHLENNTLHTVLLTDFNEFLAKLGFAFQLKSLKASEQRVIRTLNCRLNSPTLLCFVEILIAIMVFQTPFKGLSWDTFYPAICDVIDLCYLKKDEIFKHYRETVDLKVSRTNNCCHASEVGCDGFLLASAAIYCYVCLFFEDNAKEFKTRILQELIDITTLNEQHIRALATAIKLMFHLKSQ